jgi:hypothetical protein
VTQGIDPEFKPQHCKKKKKKKTGGVAQAVRVPASRPWVQTPLLPKTKERKKSALRIKLRENC